MNGPPVCPCQKTENAPTWRVRKHFPGPRFLPIFQDFCPPTPYYFTPQTQETHAPTQLNPNPNHQHCKVQTLIPIQLKPPFINTTQKEHKGNQVYL